METPRLRLLLLAHLRGLLKPDYPCGIKSAVRESLVCRALSREIHGETHTDQALMNASILSLVQGHHRPGILADAERKILQGRAYRAMHNDRSMQADVPPPVTQDVREMAVALKALKTTNFSETMQRILEDDYNRRRRR